jgi:hypothetical protein
MPAITASGPTCAAILAALKASTAVTALVPASRIVDEMPSSSAAVYPLILVETHGELPFNTLGAPVATAFGSSVMIGVRPISQYRGDQQINDITSAVRGALDGLAITIAPHARAMLTFEGTAAIFKATVGGITTREQVSEYDLTVHQ